MAGDWAERVHSAQETGWDARAALLRRVTSLAAVGVAARVWFLVVLAGTAVMMMWKGDGLGLRAGPGALLSGALLG